MTATAAPRWTLDHGQLTHDGAPILTLVRAVWGDGATPAAEIAAIERRIVALLNGSEAVTLHRCKESGR